MNCHFLIRRGHLEGPKQAAVAPLDRTEVARRDANRMACTQSAIQHGGNPEGLGESLSFRADDDRHVRVLQRPPTAAHPAGRWTSGSFTVWTRYHEQDKGRSHTGTLRRPRSRRFMVEVLLPVSSFH